MTPLSVVRRRPLKPSELPYSFAILWQVQSKCIRPSRLLDRLGALRLSFEALKEFWNGHAVLELDLVEGHGVHSSVRETQLTGPLAHIAPPASEWLPSP